MNAERLLAHFERIADAPDAVPRLRRFILDLAVRGKLVPQDPDDEPASEILRRFGKRRSYQTPNHPELTGDGLFRIPTNWLWTDLGSIGDWGSGSTPPRGNADLFGGPITWLKSGELNDNRRLSGSEETVTEAALRVGSFRRNGPGDVLFAMYGATIGRIAVLAESAVTNQAVCGCTPIDGVFNEFLFYFLLSQREHFRRASEGGAQPNVSKVKIVRSPFPLPPTSEQHRIVERVDELMAVCDGIEARIGEREARRERLTMACFGRLNTSEPAATELTGDTRFALDTLPILTARRGQIQQLRQTVVNLAVLGRLVPQDSAEEPASALLARIKNRKRELGQARVTQNATSVSVTDASIPFAPPKGWIWAQWHDLTLKIGDVDHKMPESVPDGVPYVSPRDFAPLNTIDFDRAKRISSEDYRRLAAKIRPEAGDLIYARYGTIGECRLVKVHRDFLASYSCAVIKTVPGLSEPEFQYLFSLSDVCKDQARIAENRTTQANVGIKSIKEFVVPVPPLAEQRRIVGKVNELMALCDRLEASVSNAENTRSRLLEALLADALAPVARELHAAH